MADLLNADMVAIEHPYQGRTELEINEFTLVDVDEYREELEQHINHEYIVMHFYRDSQEVATLFVYKLTRTLESYTGQDLFFLIGDSPCIAKFDGRYYILTTDVFDDY